MTVFDFSSHKSRPEEPVKKLHPEFFRNPSCPLFQLTDVLSKFYSNSKIYDSGEELELDRAVYNLYVNRFMQMGADSNSAQNLAHNYLSDITFLETAHVINAVLKNAKPNYYIVAKSFFSNFKKVKLDKLQFKHLPTDLSGYIRLPEPITDDDGTKYYHIYFYIGNALKFSPAKNFRGSIGQEVITDTIFEVALLEGETREEMKACRSFGFRFPIDGEIQLKYLFAKGKTINADTYTYSSGDLNPNVSEENLKEHPEYFKAVINLILYIYSGKPDIRDYQNTTKLPGKKRKPLRHSEVYSTLDLKLIGFSWKKEVIVKYSKESWHRSGHFKWQRHGVGLSEVKLIWLDDQNPKRRKELLKTTEEI